MLRVRVAVVDEYQFLLCLKHGIWGSGIARYKNWREGDYLVFLVDRTVAALAEVSGPHFISNEAVWPNGNFPHRIPLTFTHVFLRKNRPPDAPIRDSLKITWGYRWSNYLGFQWLLEQPTAELALSSFRGKPNDQESLMSQIDQDLQEREYMWKFQSEGRG